jgi:predicted AlkP superfamily phosphohydrolase/phosphomutase
MLFGLDCAIGPRWKAYAEAGDLPVASRLLREGTYSDNCLSPLPTLTSTNWTTIATGAWPGTHGITDFNLHKSGDDLMDCPQAFDSKDCEAEYLWNAAARQGKRSILVNYPASWPPCLENGVQIAGAGIEPTDWRIGLPAEDRKVALAAEQLFSTEGEPLSTEVVWQSGVERIHLDLSFEDSLTRVDGPLQFTVGVPQESGPHTVELGLSSGPSLGTLAEGAWSETIYHPFSVDGVDVDGAFKVKLLEVDPDRRILRIFVTDVCSTAALQYPKDCLGDVRTIAGLPVASVGFNAVSLGWVDLNTFVEILDMSNRWMEQASMRLLRQEQWDLFFIHFHSVDWFYHLASAKLDPTQTPDPQERAPYEEAEKRIYGSMDEAIGRLLSIPESPPLTVIVSDHGATSYTKHVPTRQILADAGLLTTINGSASAAGTNSTDGDDEIPYWERLIWEPIPDVDWGKTVAIPQRSCYIYINLKGRDPYGSVDPSQYSDVQERIRDALLSYRDPETAMCPFSLVLRKQDARLLGLYGDRVGDVVYAVREEFSDEHGQILGTGEDPKRFGSMRCALLFSGPGIRRGVSIDRTAWLTDVAPTVAYAAGLPMPEHAEGAVLYQALEDPNWLLNSHGRTKRNLERLTTTVQRRQALTHQPTG